MPKLSIVITAVNISPEHIQMTKECIESLKGVDEIVLIECGKEMSDTKTHIKIYFSEIIPPNKARNLGLQVATGDYIGFLNNDTKMIEGNLKDLCRENTATSPIINNEISPYGIWGAFFVAPRNIFEKIGGWDERFEMYWDDNDFIKRMEQANIKREIIESVKFIHYVGKTNPFLRDCEKVTKESELKFKQKWNL